VFGLVAVEVVEADDPALALENTLTKVIEQAEPSVVSIAIVRPAPAEYNAVGIGAFDRPSPPADPENPDFQPNNFGAGVIIAGPRVNERIVLTNYHVVHGGPVFPAHEASDGTKLFVRMTDRRGCLASIIAADPRSDLAALALNLEAAKIDSAGLKPLDWTGAAPVRKGQLVIMLGNPYALAHDGSASASWGMVSNLARRPLPWTDDLKSKSIMYRLGSLIQIDGRINLGTSGGPLLNLKGELVGLTTSLAAIEGYEKSAGFAIPMDTLTRRAIESLIAGHEVEYGMLGVRPETETPSEFRAKNTGLNQASAARVKFVALDSPAHRAGIHPGDVILGVGDVPIYSDSDLMRVVGSYPPESVVNVAVWRSRERGPLTLKVTLGKWPVMDDEGIIETTPRYAPWRGISIDYSTGRMKYQASDDRYRRAVVVTKVAESSPAQAAGIQPGMFISEANRNPVRTPREFAEATKQTRGPVELRLYEGGKITIGE
jgi:serine protease Do